jgi:hypothetical protein
MQRRARGALIAFLIGMAACIHQRTSDAVAAYARSRGAIWLPDTGAFPVGAREARDSVDQRIRHWSESPRDYYIVLEDKDSVIVFNVIHRNAFTAEGRRTLGNPGGVSGEATFDRRQHRVTDWGLWQ